MSTELLTRRMDLIHSNSKSTTYNRDTLQMDTSYPVRLSGIIVKVFLATNDYSDLDQNGNKVSDDSIKFVITSKSSSDFKVEIPYSKVFDFEGKRLKPNGFISGDYVLAIIDIDKKEIYLSSLKNADRSERAYADKYKRELNYYCNGKNDNVVLQGIVNELLSLYDINNDINESNQEYDLTISAQEKLDIFTNGKFTINIIGKFGIDYSQTKFTYGGFNRQNRSSIMTISGKTSKNNISNDDDLDMELILNWENCYIPKISYDSNEKCAALYNTKKFTRLGSGEVVYYDYWTKKNSAHFTYQKGNTSTPYGNLFPRRLVFASIEGNLPLNITFKNFSLTTFGVGIYCETDSNKTIKLIDSKISILNNMTYSVDLNNIPGDKFDITHPDFYKYMFVPLGSAIDINAFNPSVEIINCKIKNASGNRDSNLIINSCNNMRIINSTIKDFNDYSDGYKDACTMPCMDFEYFYDYSFSIENEEEQYTILNPNISLKTFNNITTTQNPNYLDIIIAHTMFYGGGEPHSRIPNKLLLMMKNRDNNTPYSESDFKDLDFSDLSSYYKSIQRNSTLTGVILTGCKFNVESKFKPGFYDTYGCIKNIPLVYKSSSEFGKANNYTLEINKYNDNVKTSTYSNKETEFMPNLFIDSSTIRATGVLYQFNANTIINNSKIFAYQFDNRYRTFQINLISGELSINNCECNYDARIKSYNGVPFRSDDNTEYNPSFIKVYPVLYSIKNPEEFDESYKYIPHYINNASLHDYQVSAPSVSILTPSKLNINNTKMIMFPDVKYNIPGLNSFKDINTRDDSTTLNKIVVFRPNNNIMNQYYETSSSIHFISTFSDDNKDDILTPSKLKSFFNPLTAPNINVSNSEFLVDNTMSFSDSYGSNKIMNNTGNNNSNDTTLCTLFKLDDRSINAFLNNSAANYKLFSDAEIANIKNDPSSFNYQEYNTSYYNIVDTVMKSDSDIDHIFKIYNFTLESSSGKIITITKFKNGTFNVDESSTIDLTNLTSSGKIKKMGLYKEYEFYRKNILISAYGIIHELKFSELPHSGYYLYNNIMDMIHDKNNGYQYRTLDTYYDFNNINDKFNNFGVVSFKLENAVFNMNNCKIGGFTGSSMRHTYGYEAFLKRSPRICFDFGGNGIYKVNNTDANAWATVLWSHINKSAFYKYNNELEDVIAPFDSSTLDMTNKGVLSINNCEFINYNALRFRQVSEDWMDYLGSNYYKGINYKSTKEIFDKGNFKYNLGSDSDSNTLRKQNSINSQAYSNYESWGLSASMSSATDGDFELNKSIFNESVRNANEMPIMFIYNHQLVDSQINHSRIMGNESVIIGGKVHFNNDILINNNNAMICYIDKFGNNALTVNNIYDSAAPKVYFNNCDIIATKDVIYDSYINHDTLSEDNCVHKGMEKYNNVITAFYVETDESYLELNGNNIKYKCNAYDDMYYIDYDARVRLIYYNQYNCKFNPLDPKTREMDYNTCINFINNDLNMLFDCPKESNYKILPDSENISVIEIKQINSDTPNTNTQYTNKSINIENNKFNIMIALIDNSDYYIQTSGYNLLSLKNDNNIYLTAKYGTNTTDNDTLKVMLMKYDDIDDIHTNILIDNNVKDTDSINFIHNSELKSHISTVANRSIEYYDGTIKEDATMRIIDKNNNFNFSNSNKIYVKFNTPILYATSYIAINFNNNFINNCNAYTINNVNSISLPKYNLNLNKFIQIMYSSLLIDISKSKINNNENLYINISNNTSNNIQNNLVLTGFANEGEKYTKIKSANADTINNIRYLSSDNISENNSYDIKINSEYNSYNVESLYIPSEILDYIFGYNFIPNYIKIYKNSNFMPYLVKAFGNTNESIEMNISNRLSYNSDDTVVSAFLKFYFGDKNNDTFNIRIDEIDDDKTEYVISTKYRKTLSAIGYNMKTGDKTTLNNISGIFTLLLSETAETDNNYYIKTKNTYVDSSDNIYEIYLKISDLSVDNINIINNKIFFKKNTGFIYNDKSLESYITFSLAGVNLDVYKKYYSNYIIHLLDDKVKDYYKLGKINSSISKYLYENIWININDNDESSYKISPFNAIFVCDDIPLLSNNNYSPVILKDGTPYEVKSLSPIYEYKLTSDGTILGLVKKKKTTLSYDDYVYSGKITYTGETFSDITGNNLENYFGFYQIKLSNDDNDYYVKRSDLINSIQVKESIESINVLSNIEINNTSYYLDSTKNENNNITTINNIKEDTGYDVNISNNNVLIPYNQNNSNDSKLIRSKLNELLNDIYGNIISY